MCVVDGGPLPTPVHRSCGAKKTFSNSFHAIWDDTIFDKIAEDRTNSSKAYNEYPFYTDQFGSV